MTDLASRARSSSATAAAYTRSAEKYAHRADEAYQTACRWQRMAAQLTGSYRLWLGNWTPAVLETNAVAWTSIGDIYLHSSFRDTGQAKFYRQLAADYRAMAAQREAQS
jgi:hypothetical protein